MDITPVSERRITRQIMVGNVPVGGGAPITVQSMTTTKTSDVETKDDLKKRVEEAAKFTDLDNLALSPQCGFASDHLGNQITLEDQIAKLKLVVETAGEIWSDQT